MAHISEEWITKYQQMRKAYDGSEATREEATEELGRLVRYFEILIEVDEREKRKASAD